MTNYGSLVDSLGVSYNCSDNGKCITKQDRSGSYDNKIECQSNCQPPTPPPPPGGGDPFLIIGIILIVLAVLAVMFGVYQLYINKRKPKAKAIDTEMNPSDI